jgi:hypothetical protein
MYYICFFGLFLFSLCVYFTVLQRQRNGEDDSDDEEYIQALYEMTKIRTIPMVRFSTKAREYTLVIKPETFPHDITVDEAMTRVYYVLKGILSELLDHLPDSAHARVILIGGDLETPISTSMQPVRNITPEVMISHIANIVQSGKLFFMQQSMKVHVIHTIVPAGQGCKKKNCIQLRDKRSVFTVCNDDNLCLAITIALGQELVDNG